MEIKEIFDHIRREEEIAEIANIIEDSGSVNADVACYEELRTFGGVVVKVPSCYAVKVDYIGMAKAIYEAGYRKIK